LNEDEFVCDSTSTRPEGGLQLHAAEASIVRLVGFRR